MRILALGDLLAPVSVDYLCRTLPSLRRELSLDLVAVNGENASFLGGIGPDPALRLLECGADVITGGNHTLQTRAIYPLLEENPRILRPINFPSEAPGYGSALIEVGAHRVLVLNAMGTAFMEPTLDSPYPYLEKALSRYEGQYSVSILDLHAEATGEKLALAHTFDGRIGAIYGTHTHIPTADEQILPRGTGYISDIGCTAPSGGIMGVRTDVICHRFRTKTPMPYKPAEGPVVAEGILLDMDEATNRCRSITRVKV